MQPMTHIKHNQAQKVADELTHLLADTYTLYLKTQNYHWNVTGPNFPSLHLLFEKQYQELADASDVIAERIRALGFLAPATFAEFQKLSSLKEGRNTSSAEEMIHDLMADHETVSQQSAMILAKAEKVNDQATMDMLIQRMREHDKTAWMLRSSLEK